MTQIKKLMILAIKGHQTFNSLLSWQILGDASYGKKKTWKTLPAIWPSSVDHSQPYNRATELECKEVIKDDERER